MSIIPTGVKSVKDIRVDPEVLVVRGDFSGKYPKFCTLIVQNKNNVFDFRYVHRICIQLR